MIRLKSILLENMTVDVADTIFSKFGVKNASTLDKGRLKDYYIALVKKHHPDVGGSNEKMKYINAAYDVLKTADPSYRLPPASDIWPAHRTYPKGPNKARLQEVAVTFRLHKTGKQIATGKSDHYDLLKMMEYFHLRGISAGFIPHIPYDDRTEKWNTSHVIIEIGYDEDTDSEARAIAVVKGIKGKYY